MQPTQSTLLGIIIGISILTLLFALWMARWVLAQPAGEGEMPRYAALIRGVAEAFFRHERGTQPAPLRDRKMSGGDDDSPRVQFLGRSAVAHQAGRSHALTSFPEICNPDLWMPQPSGAASFFEQRHEGTI